MAGALLQGHGMNAPRTHERIVSLNFQRGLAIRLMVLFHAMEHAYAYRTVTEGPLDALETAQRGGDPMSTKVMGGICSRALAV